MMLVFCHRDLEEIIKGSNERYRRLAGNQFMWRVEGMKIKQGRVKSIMIN